MPLRQTSDAESSNPANWRYTFYYAPHDPNVIVPKRGGWAHGATLNFARRGAYLILLTPPSIGVAILACVLLFAP
jgi:uncharacterized membrane protein